MSDKFIWDADTIIGQTNQLDDILKVEQEIKSIVSQAVKILELPEAGGDIKYDGKTLYELLKGVFAEAGEVVEIVSESAAVMREVLDILQNGGGAGQVAKAVVKGTLDILKDLPGVSEIPYAEDSIDLVNDFINGDWGDINKLPENVGNLVDNIVSGTITVVSGGTVNPVISDAIGDGMANNFDRTMEFNEKYLYDYQSGRGAATPTGYYVGAGVGSTIEMLDFFDVIDSQKVGYYAGAAGDWLHNSAAVVMDGAKSLLCSFIR